MLTDEQKRDIEFCKNTFIIEIDRIKTISGNVKVKEKLSSEVLISIIFLKTFSDWIKEEELSNIKQMWKFVNDIKGIIEKIFYVNHYLQRIEEHINNNSKNKSS